MGFAKTRSAVTTHFSNFRKINEDNFTMNGRFMTEGERRQPLSVKIESADSLQYFAISDGMGGEHIGDLASLTVVEGLKQEYQKLVHRQKLDFNSIKENLRRFVQSTNRAIYYLVDEPEKERVGSTIGLLYFSGAKAIVMNVGNSRVYLLRKGVLKQLSIDHTVAERYASFGMDREQSIKNGGDKQLTRTLGMDPSESELEPDFSEVFELRTGDRFLLCTDGLSIPVSEDQIKTILMDYENPKVCVEQLLNASLMEKTKDNITAMVVDILDVEEERIENRGISEEERRLLHGMEYEEEETQAQIEEESLSEIESWYQNVEEEIRENHPRETQGKKMEFSNLRIPKELILGVSALFLLLVGFGLGRITAPKEAQGAKVEVSLEDEKVGDSLEDIIYEPEESKTPTQETQGEQPSTEEATTEEGGETEASGETTTSDQVTDIYIVQKGDTLYSISMKVYGNATRVEDILKLNNISDAGKIFPKQELKLPPK